MLKMSTIAKLIVLLFFSLFVCSFSAYAEDCPTLQVLMNEGTGDNFILREAYNLIASVCSNVAQFTWNTFSRPLQAVVGLGTAIYIALYTLKNIGSFSQQDTMAYLSNEKTGVIPLGFKLAAIIWLLNNQAFLYTHIIGMAIATGAEIGTLIGHDSGVNNFQAPSDLSALFTFIINQIISFNNGIYRVIAIGRLLCCIALEPEGILEKYWIVFCFGGALYVYGWILIIGVSFFMLDVLFRLGVGCIMLPFAIACGISKLTIEYTGKTWSLFVNVAFHFIMLGIVIEFTNQMIGIASGLDNLDIPATKVLNKADADQISEALGSTTFIRTALACMISYQLFSKIEGIVHSICGGNVGNLGGELGTKAGQAAAYTAKKPITEAMNLSKAAAGQASEETKEKLKHVKNKIMKTSPMQAVANSKMAQGYRKVKHALRLDE